LNIEYQTKFDLIKDLLARGNAPLAEIYLRELPRDEGINSLYRELFNTYGISENFSLNETNYQKTERAKYLLIKAWGHGFFSEIHHLASALLLGEILKRHCIIYWGNNCIFRNKNNGFNVFSNFYKPVGDILEIENIQSCSFYPPKWSSSNIYCEDKNKFSGKGSRCTLQYFLGKDEDVFVVDFFTPIESLIPYIDNNSSFYGKSDDELYAYIFQKYLKPQKDIELEVEKFYTENMKGKNWVALHIRGSDKVYETNNLFFIYEESKKFIQRIIDLNPDINIFLMTDSDQTVSSLRELYKGKILTMESLRSQTEIGVHLQGHDGNLIGRQVLLESLVATKCDYFVGNKESNVSLAISSMKKWEKGFVFLIGHGNVRGTNPFLFKI